MQTNNSYKEFNVILMHMGPLCFNLCGMQLIMMLISVIFLIGAHE